MDTNGKIIRTFDTFNSGKPQNIVAENLFNDIEALTPNSLNEYLLKIADLDIEEAQDESKSNLLFIMKEYQAGGNSLLEDLVKYNTQYGKELANMLIEYVLKTEKSSTDELYKYTDDIEKDMKSHQNDYKKLSIDLMRLMDRGFIYTTSDYGDDILNINGEIDETVNQGNTGDCWLVASIIELSQKPAGAAALKSIISIEEATGNVIVKLKERTYNITKEEIIKSDHLSCGDDDMRAIEIAIDKCLRDTAYFSTESLQPYDIQGGEFSDVIQILFGLEADYLDNVPDISIFNNENNAYIFSFDEDGTYKESKLKATANNGEKQNLIQNHLYSIIKSDDEFIYFLNPWDSNETLKIAINEFKNLSNLSVGQFDLSKLTV